MEHPDKDIREDYGSEAEGDAEFWEPEDSEPIEEE